MGECFDGVGGVKDSHLVHVASLSALGMGRLRLLCVLECSSAYMKVTMLTSLRFHLYKGIGKSVLAKS